MITIAAITFPFTEPRDDAISRLLLESISELCSADHGYDKATIMGWYHNARDALRIYSEYRIMALDGNLLLGVAGCTHTGKILANYVAPAGVRMGIGKTMLWQMERHIIARGFPVVQVESSMTARHFYMKHNYYSDGPPGPGAGRSWNFPMKKWF